MPRKPNVKQDELNHAEKQIDNFSNEIKESLSNVPSSLPVEEKEPQTKLSKKEIKKNNGFYLKPKRTMYPSPHPKTGKIETFNEKYRKDYEYQKEYIQFVAENKEIIGETITLWTKPFAGVPAEEWDIPVNKPIWAPRYVYASIRRCRYTRMIMEEKPISDEGGFQYYGKMVATSRLERLSAYRVDGEELTGTEN